MKIFNFEIKRAKDEYTVTNKESFVSSWARPPTMNTAEWLAMFSKSPRLAVVDRIASDLANTKGRLLYIHNDGTETEITSHPFLDFMAQPNPLYEMTSSALWRLHEIHLLLVGESFFLIERDQKGRPTELWNVPPHWVKMTPYLGNPTYVITSPGGATMTVPIEDMFVMKQLNPLDPFMRGLGIAESIADEVEIDEYAAKFQKRFFYNDATPPVVFLMPDATDEQRNAFMARWNKKQQGVENSHKAAAISGNVNIKELGSSDGKNLGFIESRIAMRDAVLEHFGVPREIMGITENSNRSTADSAQYIYAKNVLTPRIKMREEAINKQLLPMFGDNLIWRFDVVIPYDKDFDKSKALEAYQAGIITKNEARKLLDLPDVKNGDVFKIAMNDVFVGTRDDLLEIESTTELKSKPVNLELLSRQETSAYNTNIKAFEVACKIHFSEQIKSISKTLQIKSDPFLFLRDYIKEEGSFDVEAWLELPEIERTRLATGFSSGLLDWENEGNKLIKMLNPLWKRTYEDGADISKNAYSLFGVDKPIYTSAAKIKGAKRITGIEATTQSRIAAVVGDGIQAGLAQNTLKEMIVDEMKSIAESRAKLIARQETSMALATGQFDMMKSAGAKTKTWHHRPQKDPRDGSKGVDHVSLEGETVGIDEKFSNGMLFPRDPDDGRAEEVINCRCYLTYSGF